MSKKKQDAIIKPIRSQIIGQVQKFGELSKETSFISPAGCKLKSIIKSKTLRSIRQKTHIICGTWGKDYKDVEEMLKMAESLRKNYVNLIFRTQFIRDPEIQTILDEVPLKLAEIIKEYKENV